MIYEHRIVYEKHHGPIPEGHDVHHKDGDKLNNDISNLELLSKLDHNRSHAGWKLIEGNWFKPCSRCDGFKPLTEFYKRPTGNGSAYCKPCHLVANRGSNAKAKAKRLLGILPCPMPQAGPAHD